jgi:hypothetical protein
MARSTRFVVGGCSRCRWLSRRAPRRRSR